MEKENTDITNNKLDKFRLNFSRCANLEVAPLVKCPQSSFVNLTLPKFRNVLAKLSRLMYFTNDNPSKKSIVRVSMGGADSLTLFRPKSPGDLAIDKQGRKLYWTDTELKKIEYGDLAGKSLAVIRLKEGKSA